MLLRIEILLLAVCSGLISTVYGFEFEDANNPNVTFGDEEDGIRQIRVNEDNELRRTSVVLLTGVEGTLTPSIFNGEDILDLEVTLTGTNEYVIEINTIDYETLGGQDSFIVEFKDDKDKKQINIHIVNLDDEPPTFSTSYCNMLENTTIIIENTTCIFTISDPDGWLSQMDFSNIIGTEGEEDLFLFTYKDIPADKVYSADVYLILQDGVLLDYEQITLYTFHIEVKDGAGHATVPLASIPIIVQVEDIGDMPPVWTSFTSILRIDEESEASLTIKAKDGDFGINNPINYDLGDSPSETTLQYISIGLESGVISISPIDRDGEDGHDRIDFEVRAYEVGDEDSELVDTITILIDDIDDNSPLLSVQDSEEKGLNFSFEENYSGELDYVIIVNDIDLGENAMYTLELDSTNGIDYTTTFQIIPGRGYEKTDLSLTIISAKKLDYEDDDWKIIEFTVVSIGTLNASHTDTLPITINLIDVNDEFPQFDQEEYFVSVYENVSIDTVIAHIRATDADAEDADGVAHELVGKTVNSILSIEHLGGDIKTTANNSFDYEKETEVLVQIRAIDAVGNTNSTQLTITVIDLNDEPPRLVVSSAIQVDENREDGYVLETSITASDDDQTANLTFSIDWEQSYGTKNSRKLDKPEEIEQIRCIEVETVEEGSNQQVSAKLSIIEIIPGNSPDYEVFDTLFVKLIVTDLNTEINRDSDSATVVINIGNLNDNAPEFVDNTAETSRSVNELAPDGTLIGQVTATDADNLEPLVYSIESVDSPNWVRIDDSTGSLYVSLEEGDEIDCDYPNPLWYINYTVSVFDGDFTTSVDISIYINDVNDQKPRLDDDSVEIFEDDGTTPTVSQNDKTTIFTLEPEDDDRDEAFRTVACSFQADTGTEIRSRFKIENNEIKVDLPEGTQLDREETPEGFNFRINCIDDPNHTGITSNSLETPANFTITLKDLNDNYPVITTDNVKFSENTEVGETENIAVTDEDLGANGEVSYFNITKVQRYEKANQVGEKEGSYDDLFSIEVNEDKKSGTLKVLDSLEGYYGYFLLTIDTQDGGTPPLTMNNSLNIIVSKYNFEQPEFSFPVDGKSYYLRPQQNILSQLTLYNNDQLKNIKATDNQQDKYNIKFSVISDENDLFVIENLANSQAQLQLRTTSFDAAKSYEVGIRAELDTDDIRTVEEAPYNVNCTITIGFFDESTDPVFDYHNVTYEIFENDENATKPLEKKAKYPDVDIADLPIYYLLNPESNIFEVGMETGTLSLKMALDYETEIVHYVTIQSSNSESLKPGASAETKLEVTINVIDVNDNPPVFDEEKYFAPILSGSVSQADVIKVTATDIDTTSQGKLYYTIDNVDTIGSLPDFNSTAPFAIDVYGQIKLQFVVTDAMKDSYFILTVTCHDEDDLQDHATVTIYTVTSENTVNFKFKNELQNVKDKKNEITALLNEAFGYTSNVENEKADSTVTETDGSRTIAPIYFVDVSDTSVTAVKGSEILKQVTNMTIFNQLKANFSNIGLSLDDFASKEDTNENLEEMLKMWLIGVSVVLGALCICLIVALILKTRALNKRIKNLSSTKFGSQESGLNRAGVSAPTTNKHAIEGSNPVYNKDNDVVEQTKDFNNFDRKSITSGDSDMIGVEDDDTFGYGENEKHKESFN